MGPAVPPEVADASVKSTVPKSASGRTEHWVRRHNDGASAIHSADDSRAEGALPAVVNVQPRLLDKEIVNMDPAPAATLAVNVSPGTTGYVEESRTTAAAGYSS